MPESLATLEQQRSEILTHILQLGDFRSGSITAIRGRCGKANCHCHQPGQPGHGPNFRLTRKVDRQRELLLGGRTAESPARGGTVPSLSATQSEVAGGERKNLKGTPGGRRSLTRGKKTAEAIHQEITREVEQLLQVLFIGRRKTGHFDLEAIEMTVRSAMHQAGSAALTQLLQFPAPDAAHRTVSCPCGQQAHYQELRAKPVLTAVGKVKVLRPYYLCAHCHTGQFPADVELDIEHTEFSPGVRRMNALVGQQTPFDQGRQQMKLLADLEVTAKAVERTAEAIGGDIAQREQREIQRAVQLDLPIVVGEPVPILYVQMDGTGVPVVNKETLGRQGKVDGQPAHTREAKLGCVFTQTTWDKEGCPLRDPDSTTYTGAIETAEEFGKRLYLEAWKRGWSRAENQVVMGDGAEWIWNLAEQHFPGAVQIVDLYHARQHLWELARKLHPNDEAKQKAWMKVHQIRLLDKGKIEKLVTALRSIHSSNPELAQKIRMEADYFARNAQRMRYPQFRCQHLFVGSGVIEAGCKTVIGSRLKQSGMFWTIRGANAILALRCCHLNGRFEDYWEAAPRGLTSTSMSRTPRLRSVHKRKR